mgnify:FL=1
MWAVTAVSFLHTTSGRSEHGNVVAMDPLHMVRLDSCQQGVIFAAMKKQTDPIITPYMAKIAGRRWKGMDGAARSEALKKAWVKRRSNAKKNSD